MENKLLHVKLVTFVGNYGQMIREIALDFSAPVPGEAQFSLTGNFNDISGIRLSEGITEVRRESGGCRLVLTVDPFLYRHPWKLVSAEGILPEEGIGAAAADETSVDGLEDFEPHDEGGILYRLYRPAVPGPRPLILFLHGGGECGSDNIAQMTGTLGALFLAKKYPEMAVMAPQAPDGGVSFAEMAKLMNGTGRYDPFAVDLGAEPRAVRGGRGWNREVLGLVAARIRGYISEGLADPTRIYVTGMSMGGAGTITALGVDPYLFAAAVPICPSTNGETWPILKNIQDVPVWIGAAYIDHAVDRHANLLNAVTESWLEGRKNLRLTLFTKRELAAYGIGNTPGLTEKQIYGENHSVWVPVLRNEKGMMDWMVSHRRIG